MAVTPPTDQNTAGNLNCPRCDALLPPYAIFCSSCGEQFNNQQNGEGEKRTENGNDDVQERKGDEVRIRGLSLTYLQSLPVTLNPTVPERLDQIPETGVPAVSGDDDVQEQEDDAVRIRALHLQSLPVTPTPSIPETWQHIPETEASAFLSHELTAPSIPAPDMDTIKQSAVPFSERLEQQITRLLPTVSHLFQRGVALNPRGSNWLWPTIIILSAVAAGLVNFVFTDTAMRPFIVFWFLFVCPGMVLVRFLRLNQPVVEWTLALALSFAIDAIVAGIQLYAGKWSPPGTLSILIGFSLGAAIVQLITARSAATSVAKQPHILRSGKLGVLLSIALALLIALFVAASLWSYMVYQGLHSATSAQSQQHETTSPSSPREVSIPTPLSTSSTIKPGTYYGTIFNLQAAISTKMSLTSIQLGKISGTFTGLHLNGPFKGTMDGSKHVQFTVMDDKGQALLFFDGMVQSDTTIAGNYCSLDQQGQCGGKYGYGLWSVTSAP
ncbi:MAG: hypothetical protein ACJ788_22395 [Ktedonobacteraceae bacterium]